MCMVCNHDIFFCNSYIPDMLAVWEECSRMVHCDHFWSISTILHILYVYVCMERADNEYFLYRFNSSEVWKTMLIYHKNPRAKARVDMLKQDLASLFISVTCPTNLHSTWSFSFRPFWPCYACFTHFQHVPTRFSCFRTFCLAFVDLVLLNIDLQ